MYPDTNLGMTGCTGSCGGSAPGCPAPERCPDGSGTLPECAPLAVPYVPFQQTGSKRYTQQEAVSYTHLPQEMVDRRDVEACAALAAAFAGAALETNPACGAY